MKAFERYEEVLAFAIARVKTVKVSTTSVSDANVSIPHLTSIQVKFGVKNLVPWSAFATGFLISVGFILFQAETFQEYSECMYPLVTTLLNLGNFAVLVLQGGNIFKLIDQFERTMESREFYSFHLDPHIIWFDFRWN